MNLAGSTEWDGLVIRAWAERPDQPVLAGEVRRVWVEVKNPSERDRTGKLVHGSCTPEVDDYWILPTRLTVPAHGTYTIDVADFLPVLVGRTYWSLFTLGSFEGNEQRSDAELRMSAAQKDAHFRPLFSFIVFDRDELTEHHKSVWWEWVRWVILVAVALAGAVGTYLLLSR